MKPGDVFDTVFIAFTEMLDRENVDWPTKSKSSEMSFPRNIAVVEYRFSGQLHRLNKALIIRLWLEHVQVPRRHADGFGRLTFTSIPAG